MVRQKTMIEFAEQINTFMRQTVGALSMVDSQLNKLNDVLYGLLKDLDKLEAVKCANCKEDITRPQVSGLPRQDDCPSCGGSLFVNKQNAVKDWDYGIDKGTINDSINCQAIIAEKEGAD